MKNRLQMQKIDNLPTPKRRLRKRLGRDSRLDMSNWQRKSGTSWVRHLGTHHALVNLGRGGWYWIVTTNTGHVVTTGGQPTQRSRKARKQAQAMLLHLESQRVVVPVTKVRLTDHNKARAA